jgi:cytochrome P450
VRRWLRLARAPANPLRFLTDLSRTEGDVARVRIGPVKVWLLTHPDDVERMLTDSSGRLSKGKSVEGAKRLLGEGLLTSAGEHHDRQRPLVGRAFQAETLAAMATPTIVRLTTAVADTWQPGQTIDAFEEMGRLALDVIATVALGDEDGRLRGVVGGAFDAFDGLALPFLTPLARVPLPSNRRFAEARRRVDAALADLIAERRRHPSEDLVSVLAGTGMSDQEVRDEVMNLFSGHKSVAVALTWALYLLAQHPDALDRTEPRLVLAEAMRMYPPVWVVPRKVGGEGWTTADGTTVPAGTMVVVSTWVTHRDPRFHPDPERFDPERFLPEASAGRHPFAYFPFGGGPRSCIGQPLAWLEGSTVLATLAARWRFRVDPRHTVRLAPKVTLRPKHGVHLIVERRERESSSDDEARDGERRTA